MHNFFWGANRYREFIVQYEIQSPPTVYNNKYIKNQSFQVSKWVVLGVSSINHSYYCDNLDYWFSELDFSTIGPAYFSSILALKMILLSNQMVFFISAHKRPTVFSLKLYIHFINLYVYDILNQLIWSFPFFR